MGTGGHFNEMAFSIEKATVTAKSRALKAEYSMELAQDLKVDGDWHNAQKRGRLRPGPRFAPVQVGECEVAAPGGGVWYTQRVGPFRIRSGLEYLGLINLQLLHVLSQAVLYLSLSILLLASILASLSITFAEYVVTTKTRLRSSWEWPGSQ